MFVDMWAQKEPSFVEYFQSTYLNRKGMYFEGDWQINSSKQHTILILYRKVGILLSSF